MAVYSIKKKAIKKAFFEELCHCVYAKTRASFPTDSKQVFDIVYYYIDSSSCSFFVTSHRLFVRQEIKDLHLCIGFISVKT